MKNNRKVAIATIALATSFGLVSAPAQAQTTAPGPYYATPSWDQTLPASTRFIVLSNWNSAAVLDRETGLVWERSPAFGATDWQLANLQCHALGTAGTRPSTRLGWRLPSVEELLSLVDPTQSNPALPLGHPFQDIQNTAYWTASNFERTTDVAYAVDFSVGSLPRPFKDNFAPRVWCVRGASSVANPF
jgi:hypothetical protein